jgi:hypothetical protein
MRKKPAANGKKWAKARFYQSFTRMAAACRNGVTAHGAFTPAHYNKRMFVRDRNTLPPVEV